MQVMQTGIGKLNEMIQLTQTGFNDVTCTLRNDFTGVVSTFATGLVANLSNIVTALDATILLVQERVDGLG